MGDVYTFICHISSLAWFMWTRSTEQMLPHCKRLVTQPLCYVGIWTQHFGIFMPKHNQQSTFHILLPSMCQKRPCTPNWVYMPIFVGYIWEGVCVHICQYISLLSTIWQSSTVHIFDIYHQNKYGYHIAKYSSDSQHATGAYRLNIFSYVC